MDKQNDNTHLNNVRVFCVFVNGDEISRFKWRQTPRWRLLLILYRFHTSVKVISGNNKQTLSKIMTTGDGMIKYSRISKDSNDILKVMTYRFSSHYYFWCLIRVMRCRFSFHYYFWCLIKVTRGRFSFLTPVKRECDRERVLDKLQCVC